MTTNNLELDDATYEQIKKLCSSGDRLASAGQHDDAIADYNKAWSLVPEPKNDWEASTWILAAIADACFLADYKTSAREALAYAMTCPNAIGNPFLHLRYGQVLYDAGELDLAANELIRAYMGGGDEIFSTEKNEYLSFIKSRANFNES